MPATLQTIAAAFLCVCLAALIETAIIDWETLGAMLLISLVTLPSIVGYALGATYLSGRPIAKYVTFFAPAILVSIACAGGLMRETTDTQVYDLIKWFFVLYVVQLGTALGVLLVTWRDRRAAG